MHFSVLVIGHDPEEQLARYSERLIIPEQHEAEPRHYTTLVQRYGIDYTLEDARTLAFEEGYEDAEMREDRTVTLHTSYNSEGRWDWWVVGGRWSNLLPVTSKAREDARDSKLTGVTQATLSEVLWNEDTLLLVHSILLNGEWHDLPDSRTDPTRGSLLEQFHTLTSGLAADTPVTVIDCHV